MFNVFVLLLDNALLKCVVTEVVLFSIVALYRDELTQAGPPDFVG